MSQPFEREKVAAVRAVRQAAVLCQAVGREISPEVLAKNDKSPVTVADFGSQALICRALAEHFPDDPLIAEEDSADLARPENTLVLDRVVQHVRASLAGLDEDARGSLSGPLAREMVCRWIDRGASTGYCSRFWALDPIDGTKGFLRGEQYAIALALIIEGRIAVAALACPNLHIHGGDDHRESSGPRGAIFSAVRGQGAFVVPSEEARGTNPAALRVSQCDKPEEARFCESVESGHSAQGDAAAIAARLGITMAPLRMDSQCKYAVVARGEADLYLRLPTRPDYREKIWDHAAGVLIVEEAGGVVTDITGRPLEFHHGRELAANRGVVVSNGRLHERVLEAVRALAIRTG
jgi:3'(2'), 5'-bisphosphate nucleotidase